jgi:predicted acylesterase/phospholipase RssA
VNALISLAALLLLLSGCCTRPNSPFAGLSPAQARTLARKITLRRDQELQADIRNSFTSPQNVLILSGGDASGSFGCGILNGWRNAQAGRPRFDVVTGVSTGGFIAVFAFLGQEQDDAVLRNVYTTIRDKDVFEGPPGGSSVYHVGPLKRLIAKYITTNTLQRIAAAHAQGRRLYVTTVEIESGALCIWPLSEIAFNAVHQTPSLKPPSAVAKHAAGTIDEAALDRFRQILLAAAAIPVFFPPVELDGGLHFDAGLREAVSLRPFMLGPERSIANTIVATGDLPLAQAPASYDSPPTVWAILNGKLHSSPKALKNNLLSIGLRSLEIYNETCVLLSLRDAAHLAAGHNPAFQFRWLGEPDDLDPAPGVGLFQPMFVPSVTKRLYAAGQLLGQSGPSAWNQGPPPIESESLQ